MKKFLSLVLGFVLLFSLFPSLNADAAIFNDVKQYEKEIDFLKKKGVISGYPDGSFKPTASVTRLQAVSMILREKGIKDFAASDPKFTDMKPGSYGYTEIAKAVQLGFISGKTAPDGTKYFDPYATLTRSQFAKIVAEGYKLPASEHYTFYDVPKNHPSAKYVSTLANERITTGYADGTFKPNGKISRQHFAAFFARMLDDRFKPSAPAKNVSYAMDPTKTYMFRNNDGLTTYKFTAEKYYEYDIWNVISKGINEEFIVKEDHTGHYTGYMGSHFWEDLKYPVKIGLKWGTEDEPGGFDVGISTITSTTETVTTPAGTFKNVVVVKNSYGSTSYYAQNVGLVKSVNDGNVHELVEIK